MKVIKPGYKIIPVSGGQDPSIKIGRCIQSLQGGEGGLIRESLLPLLQEHMRRGEEQLLELGDLAFDIQLDSETPMSKFFERQPSRISVDRIEKKRYLLSGNIRGLRDLYRAHKNLKIVKALVPLWLKDYEWLFIDIIPKYRPGLVEGVIVNYAADKELEQLPLEFKIRHLYLTVHFTASLHAIYELIAGCRISAYVVQKQVKRNGPKELCFVQPPDWPAGNTWYESWVEAINEGEKAFLALSGIQKADQNQSVLPLALKTDLVINTNLLEWMQIFNFGIRMDIPSEIRGLIPSLFNDIKGLFPGVFENIVLPEAEKGELLKDSSV